LKLRGPSLDLLLPDKDSKAAGGPLVQAAAEQVLEGFEFNIKAVKRETEFRNKVIKALFKSL
jgi:hypothetical protein